MKVPAEGRLLHMSLVVVPAHFHTYCNDRSECLEERDHGQRDISRTSSRDGT